MSRTTRLPAAGRLAPVSSALCCRGFLPVEGSGVSEVASSRASGRLCSVFPPRSAWGTDLVLTGVLMGPGHAAHGRERRALPPFLRPRGSLIGIGTSPHQESQASEVLGPLHHLSPVPPDVPSACNGTDPPSRRRWRRESGAPPFAGVPHVHRFFPALSRFSTRVIQSGNPLGRRQDYLGSVLLELLKGVGVECELGPLAQNLGRTGVALVPPHIGRRGIARSRKLLSRTHPGEPYRARPGHAGDRRRHYRTLPRAFSGLAAFSALGATIAGTVFLLGGKPDAALYGMEGLAILGMVSALVMIVAGGTSGRVSGA